MISNYFRIAFRSLWKNRSTSIINIGGLAVGMTAAILILLWVKNETSFDTYHPQANNIFRLTSRIEANNWTWESTPLLLAAAVKDEVPEVEHVSRLYADHWPVFKINGQSFYQRECAYVDEDWFRMFKYHFIAGTSAQFDRHLYNVILSASAAKKYFGTTAAVGRTILIDRVSYAVTGVVKDPPTNSSFQYHAFIPVAALLTDPQRKQNDEQWNNYNYITFIKKKPQSKGQNLAAKIGAIMRKNDKEGGAGISLVNLKDIHFETAIQNSSFRRGNLDTVYIFSILAFLLLLIACINYINLTTAKASLRAKEVSIRKITGANRRQLFAQFMTESLVVSVLALFATVYLVQLVLPVFNRLTGTEFVLHFWSAALWQTAGLTLFLTFLLNSIYPALVLSSFQPLNVFRGATLLKVKDSYFRRGLVVLQFTVSVILIAGTIIINSQMNFIRQANPGYNRAEVLAFAIPPTVPRESRQTLMQTIKNELLQQSSITNVATSNQRLVNLGSVCTGCVDWEGRDTSFNKKLEQLEISQLAVDADFKNTMELSMAEGRWFTDANTSDRHGVVLNETAAKTFNLQPPVTGKRFIFKGDTGQVIGVVKDFNFRSLHEKTGPLVAFMNPEWRNHVMVRSGAGNAPAAVTAVQNIWKTHFPETPLEYEFLDEAFDNLYKDDQKASFLVLVFALIAVVISALGLFSLAAFSAEQRTREIGIRKVLGANVFVLTSLLSKEFLQLVLVALVLAIPLAYWGMHEWLQAFAYKVPVSWWMFASAALLAIGIALVTVSFQAVRAAMANPVKCLRTGN